MNLLATDEQVSAEINPGALLSILHQYMHTTTVLMDAVMRMQRGMTPGENLTEAWFLLNDAWTDLAKLVNPPIISHQGTAIGDDNR